MKEFIKKIAVRFDTTDFKEIGTKEGFLSTLKGWGCPADWMKVINDENWEEYRDIVYDACL